MKKFLTAILFLVFSGLSFAQAVECIDVQITPVIGNCYADNAIRVTAKSASPYPSACKPSSGQFIVQFKGMGKDNEVYKMTPYPVAAGGTASYTLSDLESGTYTVVVRDAITGAIVERSVKIVSSYKPMNIQALEGLAPTCNLQGGVRFRIPTGGKGPFDITLLDKEGNTVLLPTQRFPRPTGNNYIEVRGTTAHPIVAGQELRVQIKDVTSSGDNCGETQRLPVKIPATIKTPECLKIRMFDYRELIVSDVDCGKYKAAFIVRKAEDNAPLWQNTPNINALLNYFRMPGRAVVRFISSTDPAKVGTTLDISSTFDNNRYHINNYIIQKGDVIEITITGGQNTIKETVRFNEQIDPPTCASYGLFSVANGSYNIGIPAGCTTGTTKQLSLFYSLADGTYRDMPNVTQGGTYRYYVRFQDERKIDVEKMEHFTLEAGTSISGPWSPVPMTDAATAAPGQARWTHRRIYLDNVGEGYYRITYKNTNNCFETCTRVIRIFYPNPSLPSVDKIWDYYSPLYGMHEGTGAFMIRFLTNQFISPLTVKVEPADGTKSITYTPQVGHLAASQSRTVTFPLTLTQAFNSASSNWIPVGYTNLPARRYRITVTDGCGRTTTRDFDFLKTEYKPEPLSFNKDCSVAQMLYKSTGGFVNTLYNITLQKYNDNGTLGIPLLRNIDIFNGSFDNLLPGKYRLKLVGNPGTTTYLTNKKWLYYSLSDSGVPVTEFEKDIEVKPIEPIDPMLSSLICDQGVGTYMIAADVTGQPVKFPLTFNLYERPSATATNTTTPTPLKTHTYQESDNKYYHVFDGLAPGKHYVVETKHVCRTVRKYISLRASDTFEPTLVIDRPVPFCKGNVATVQLLGVPESIFEIRWFKLDANGNKTSASPYRVNSSFSEAIFDTTSYLAEYRIRPGIGCSNNNWYTKTATVVMPPANLPSVSNCPQNITATATVGRCDAPVSWTEPVGEPSCLGGLTTTRNHAPGDWFTIGTHTVTYTFTDASGNTNSCTFFIKVNPRGLRLKTTQRYTDAGGNAITQLQPNQQFYYELRYENAGSENINKATINVKLPNNVALVSNGAPDLSGAGDGSVANPQPTSAYSAANKTWRFEIGSGSAASTLKLGSPERVIRIPLKIANDCNTLLKPCENYLQTDLSFNYEGGPQGCSALLSEEASASITVDTSGCDRQEVQCGTGAITFNAIGGFTTYQWYNGTTLLAGETNASFTPSAPGIYKVVKTISCHGVNLTVTETIDYISVGNIQDPIKAQAQNIGVTCAQDGGWTSQFYLCTGGSKAISVDYNNTPYEWQSWNGSCNGQASSQPDCRIKTDDCWSTLSSGKTFTLTTAGLYRLKFLNSGCDKAFYFQVITGGLSGSISDKKDETPFEQG
ncbi:HYR domain-containing protein, partial [Capnocytophaga leadbetteri]|uniref:HYR domain-containing protein n=1 Tax=Capnocytophaga leadbetteri TaxID=327575 RepID=UPI0028E1E22A